MKKEMVSCDFCGRDTPNKCRICKVCTGGHEHNREYAAAGMTPLSEWEGECEHDYSEDALGPKQAEDRVGAVWSDENREWRKV